MRGLVPANFPRRNGRSKRRWVLQPHDRVGLGAAELIFENVDLARAEVAAPDVVVTRGVVAARSERLDSPDVFEMSSTERDQVVSSQTPVVPAKIERELLNSTSPAPAVPAMSAAPAVPAPRVLPVNLELAAAHRPQPFSAPQTAQPPEPQPTTSQRTVQPTITDLNDDADDVDDDAASSKASIDFEAIKNWGPLAVAVARGHRHELPRAATGADEHDNENHGRARPPWLLIALGLIVVVVGALAIWFATSRA